jgi:hypothetical protein
LFFGGALGAREFAQAGVEAKGVELAEKGGQKQGADGGVAEQFRKMCHSVSLRNEIAAPL